MVCSGISLRLMNVQLMKFIPKVGGHRIHQDTQCYGSQVIYQTYRSQQILYSEILTEPQTYRSLSSVTLCIHESAETHVTKALLNLVNIVCIDPCRNVDIQCSFQLRQPAQIVYSAELCRSKSTLMCTYLGCTFSCSVKPVSRLCISDAGLSH